MENLIIGFGLRLLMSLCMQPLFKSPTFITPHWVVSLVAFTWYIGKYNLGDTYVTMFLGFIVLDFLVPILKRLAKLK